MTQYEYDLKERLGVIKDVITTHGEENFYLSFSGGKDSTALHYIIDMALPNNRIPRVYIDTGIEYLAIKEFVQEMAVKDDRITIIKPTTPIRQMLEKVGYPFKSKEHSEKLDRYQHGGLERKAVRHYLQLDGKKSVFYACPKKLLYQFTSDFKLKVSSRCCDKLKKEPVRKWQKENNKTIVITGMRKEEGGQRTKLACAVFNQKTKKLSKFHPLAPVSEEFLNKFIKQNNIKLCKLYYPPFSFKRTGCKGCPYSLDLEKQLEIMHRLLPSEAKQCETIWQPVYSEYRRIEYRLKNNTQIMLELNLGREKEKEN